MANFDKIKSKLQGYGIQTPEEYEDPVPYKPEAGTMENIGRFMLNNMATGPSLPAIGSMKVVGKGLNALTKEAPAAAAGENLLQKASQTAVKEGEGVAALNAQKLASEQAAEQQFQKVFKNEMDNVRPPTLQEVAMEQQKTNRATDFAQRLKNQIADRQASRMEAAKKITGGRVE